MKRKAFLEQVGIGAAMLLTPMCLASLGGCKKDNTAPVKVDFTLDVSTGALSRVGGFLIKDGVIVAHNNAGIYLAVSAACTHEGTHVDYDASRNNFVCPNHNAKFSSTGVVTQGPANSNLIQYNTTLTGNSLRVFS